MAVALPCSHAGSGSAPCADADGDVVRETPVTVPARDGYALAGTLYERQDAASAAEVVVFNAGGGIAAARYRHFLRYLASRGVPTLAYDYRGVGRSAPARRRGFDAGVEDWAELDQAAALDYMHRRHPRARLGSVSHSIGCMVAAAAPNARLVEQFVFIAPHTAYWGDYRQPWRWPMAFVWHVFMPAAARIVGYFPASWFGLGDDFPRRVALQWAARTTPHFSLGAYGGDAPREFALIGRLSESTGAALVMSSVDDAFASDRAIRRFVMSAPRLRLVRRNAVARGARSQSAHWAFFRRKHAVDWQVVVDFLGRQPGSYAVADEWIVD